MKKLDVKHLTVTYNEAKDMLIYDRKLKDGPGESMYGLEVCKSLHLPKDFLENAYNIRKKYNKLDEGILSKKMCNNKVGTEVHHLQHQENADKNNMINSFHKNHPANLLTVCDGCHNSIHKTGKQHKKVKTNKGTKIMEIRE